MKKSKWEEEDHDRNQETVRKLVAGLSPEEMIELWDYHRKFKSTDDDEKDLNNVIATHLLGVIADEFVRQRKSLPSQRIYAGLVSLGMALESGKLGTMTKMLRSQPNNRAVSDEQIKEIMEECGNNRTQAAKRLGISTRQLRRRLNG